MFRHACRLGLEGIVSKRLDTRYKSGPCRSWLKVKNLRRTANLGALQQIARHDDVIS
jgi:ATP-dependent DNA ligase